MELQKSIESEENAAAANSDVAQQICKYQSLATDTYNMCTYRAISIIKIQTLSADDSSKKEVNIHVYLLEFIYIYICI